MADDRYRDNRTGGGRGRTSSIFSDDDNGGGARAESEWNPEEKGWGPKWEASRSGGGRGLFERARDEVSNWFGGDEDDRSGGRSSPERSRYGQGQSGFGGEHYRSNSSGAAWEARGGGGGSDRGQSYRSGGGSSAGGYAGREQSNTSHFDENYRRWREQQIARLDEEYEEYCRERQQRFESDFHSWRESRQAQGSGPAAGQSQSAPSGADQPWGNEEDAGGSLSGSEGAASRSALLGGGEPGTHEAGAETTGGGDASAMESSTGSSPDTGADGQGRY
jgi:hypothetical protein